MDKKRDAPQKEKRSSTLWTRDLTTELITLYKQHPALYLSKNVDYHNETVRREALEAIATKLNMTACRKVVDFLDVQRKIHGVRTQYMRELRLMKKSVAYSPKLWCFGMLGFLKNCGSKITDDVTSSLMTDDFKEENFEFSYEDPIGGIDEKLETSSVASNETDSPSSASPPAEKKVKVTTALSDDICNSEFSSLEESNNTNVLFGKMLTAEMETVRDEEILDGLKEEIMTALFRAKRKYREKKERQCAK